MPIQVLSPEVASQIAAGEVVERPASVVKELLENSLDAGAEQVVIQVVNGGRKLVEVSDDGHGIPARELALAVQRHATSKLSQAEDLLRIHTLGFRGEALASIGSVSRMTIVSRTLEEQVGARLRVEGGLAEALIPTGAPTGTSVRVEDLFYNVPARLKFLKTENTERRQIDSLVTRYALAYPQVRVHLKQEGRSALQTSGNGNRREVLAKLYGVEVARQMLEVLAEDDLVKVSGFISPTSLSRSNRREITFFVNGRPVQDVTLNTALVQAYHNYLMVSRYPIALLFLELVPDSVDVNVHPTKAEVRFRDAKAVFSSVQRAVRRALMAHSPVPGLQTPATWSGYVPQGVDNSVEPAWRMPFDRHAIPGGKYPEQQSDLAADQPKQQEGGRRVPILRAVGQVAMAFLVAEGPDGLYLIDQHAAHERVLFEKFMAQHHEYAQRSSQVPSQALLQPVVVEFPPAQARLVSEQLPVLEQLGFRVESFGPAAYQVRAVPAMLAGMDPSAALNVLVENFEEDETPLMAEIEARVIARVCKRAAVKAGQALSLEEQKGLISELEACQSPRTCPHGRPTMIHLSVDLLERQFGRKGPR